MFSLHFPKGRQKSLTCTPHSHFSFCFKSSAQLASAFNSVMGFRASCECMTRTALYPPRNHNSTSKRQNCARKHKHTYTHKHNPTHPHTHTPTHTRTRARTHTSPTWMRWPTPEHHMCPVASTPWRGPSKRQCCSRRSRPGPCCPLCADSSTMHMPSEQAHHFPNQMGGGGSTRDEGLETIPSGPGRGPKEAIPQGHTAHQHAQGTQNLCLTLEKWALRSPWPLNYYSTPRRPSPLREQAASDSIATASGLGAKDP